MSVMILILVLFISLCFSAHPCSQHLSSCRNCLGDTANQCQFCRTAPGLGQCIPPGDVLITACQTFQASNLSTLITSLSQCKTKKKFFFFFFLDNKKNIPSGPATGSAAENCAAHSTSNSIKCNDCLSDTANQCSWCGTAATGSCHSTVAGNSANSLCQLLLRGQLITAASVASQPSLANQCPNTTVPNYCVTYQTCAACQADSNCAFCLSFNDDCLRETRCIAKQDRQTCIGNAMLRLPFIIGPAPDLDITCPNLPLSCSELDALTATSGGGGSGGSSTTTSSSSGAGGSTTASVGGSGSSNSQTFGGGSLPSACDDIAILDKCVTKCGTSANVDQCKCVDGAEKISCLDSKSLAPVATSSASRMSLLSLW